MKKQVPLTANVTWLPLAGGELAIGHKPGKKTPVEGLKNEGATVVVTLLQENEGAQTIGQAVAKAGMEGIWFPFSAGQPYTGADLIKPLRLFKQLQNRLAEGNKVYLHCSAGIHRTGMIAYGLLRYLGFTKTEALHKLAELRPVTTAQVGDDKLRWAEMFAAKTEHPNPYLNFAHYDENMTDWIDYSNCNGNTWPYLSDDFWMITAYFKTWLEDVQAAFPDFDFLFDKDHGSEYLHYNFHTITIRDKAHANAHTGIVFMIHQHVPLAVWGTGIFREEPPNAENYDKWYIPPGNLYLNTLGDSYQPVVTYMVNSLQNQGLNFTAKDILLRQHHQPAEEMKYLNIDIDNSLRTLYGYTYNVKLTWMVE